MYCKRKTKKKSLYKKYNINLISIDPDVFSNSFEIIQEKLKNILNPILIKDLKIIDREYMTSPNKLSDNELFEKIMELSEDNITLPKQRDYPDNKKYLFYEALRRFKNYNRFARHFDVATNNKRNYWNRNSVLSRMMDIKMKYGYMPTCVKIRNEKLAKSDLIFVGIVDGIKKNI